MKASLPYRLEESPYVVLTSNTPCQIIAYIILTYCIQLNKNHCVKNAFSHTKATVLSTHFPIIKSTSACVWACVSNCIYLRDFNSNNWSNPIIILRAFYFPTVKFYCIRIGAPESLIASFVLIIIVAVIIRFIFSWEFNLTKSGTIGCFSIQLCKNLSSSPTWFY